MAAVSFAPTRRRSLTASAAASPFSLLLLFLIMFIAAMVSLATPATALAQQAARTGGPTPEPSSGRAAENNPIRPYHINVPEAALVDRSTKKR